MDGSAYKVADDIMSLARKLKPLFSAAREFEKLGDLNSFTKELQHKAKAAEEQADQATKLKNDKLSELKETELKIEGLEDEIREKHVANTLYCKDKIEAAKVVAKQLIAQADFKKREANRILTDSEKSALDIDLVIRNKQKQLDDLNSEITAIKSNLAFIIGD